MKGDTKMTVKDAVNILPDDGNIDIVYSSIAMPLDKKDPLMLDAYGDYLIDKIQAFHLCDQIHYELNIVLRPVKA